MDNPSAYIVALATLTPASRLAIPHTVECIHAMVTDGTNFTPTAEPAMVQIGAHLAWQNPNDPFGNLARTARLRTVLVEPQPHIARRLGASVRAAASDGDAVGVRLRGVAGNDGTSPSSPESADDQAVKQVFADAPAEARRAFHLAAAVDVSRTSWLQQNADYALRN